MDQPSPGGSPVHFKIVHFWNLRSPTRPFSNFSRSWANSGDVDRIGFPLRLVVRSVNVTGSPGIDRRAWARIEFFSRRNCPRRKDSHMRYWRKSYTIALITAAATALLFLLARPQNAAPPVQQTAPTRVAGKPDFSGIWQANNTANWDLQTHAARPMIGQPGLTPSSVFLAAPVVGLGTIGWVPGGLGVVDGNDIPYLP